MLKLIAIFRYVGCLAALLALCACRRDEKISVIIPPAPEQGVRPADPGVIECTGVLHPAHVFALHVKPGEIVDTICVKAGDKVRAGDTLAVLSCPALQTEWLATNDRILDLRRATLQTDSLRWKKEVAESRLVEFKKQIAVAESLRGKVADYDPQVHARPLMDERTRTEKEIEGLARDISAGLELQQAAAPLLRAAEQRVIQLEAQISNLVVRSPCAGVAVRVEATPAAADGMLLEIHDRSHFNAQGLLWQNQLAAMKIGSLVTVIPDFIPGCCWTGTVTFLGMASVPDATPSFPRFPVTVSLEDGPDTESLRDGMTVFMQIHRVGKSAKEP